MRRRPDRLAVSWQVPPRPTRCAPPRVRCCHHSSEGSRLRPPCPTNRLSDSARPLFATSALRAIARPRSARPHSAWRLLHCPGVSRELLQLVFAARIAEYNLMSRSREDGSELAAHQPRTKNAYSHSAPLSRCVLNPQSKSIRIELSAHELVDGTFPSGQPAPSASRCNAAQPHSPARALRRVWTSPRR